MLGIAVVTYKRLPFLQRVIEGILEHTKQPYELIVAEDGGNDGSAEWLRAKGIKVVTGQNRGVCWNKNRGLFPLFLKGCDPILLLEDDCFPVEPGWEASWIEASARWHHLAYAHPKIASRVLAGDGSAANPFRNPKATAQCTAVSLEAMTAVGFLDTRFSGYGVGHVEWTSRFRRIKAGYEDLDTPEGRVRCNIYISGGLAHDDGLSFRDNKSVARNKDLFIKVKSDSLFRFPWSTTEQRSIFLQELSDCGLDPWPYLATDSWIALEAATPLPEPFPEVVEDEPLPVMVEAAAVVPGWEVRDKRRKARSQGLVESIKALTVEDKRLSPLFNHRRSFLLETSWLDSVVEKRPLFMGETVPWLNYCAIRILTARLNKEMHLFEYGSGYSTEWFEKRVASITSVEHEQRWFDLVKQRMAEQGSKAQLMYCELDYDGQYCRSIERAPARYDVVVVDGRDRVNCMLHAYPFLKEDGVIIFDNSQRAHYREGIESFMAAQGFKELQLSGPAPMVHVECFTSILYRSDNCLKI